MDISFWFDASQDLRIVLKDCTFCGGRPYMHQQGNMGFKQKVYIIVGCKPCRFEMKNASLGRIDFTFLAKATSEEWNKRANKATEQGNG